MVFGKRKHADTIQCLPISSFARVSKGQAFPDALSKKIAIPDRTSTKKRKTSPNAHEQHLQLAQRNTSFSPSSDEDDGDLRTKRQCRRQETRLTPLPSPIAIKGKRTARSVASRTVSAHKPVTSTIISKSRQSGKTVQTKIDAVLQPLSKTPKKKDSEQSLPAHLVDLVNLHRAFLKTVRLQLAHNGTSSPLSIRTLLPHVSQAWGKRQVTIEDIRRCIAVQAGSASNDSSPLIISDYGRGRLFLELAPHHDAASMNEERLCKQFIQNLQFLGNGTRKQGAPADLDVSLQSLSIAELPQATITTVNATKYASPALTKGQKALSEMKDFMVSKIQEQESSKQAATDNITLNPDGTKMNLLDRLRLKQLAKADGPLPLSPAELQRVAALNRVPDVAATVSMLSLSTPISLPRQAFTMPVILEKLKDSMRVPMSKEEGAACIRIIAVEVAPEWLKIVKIGGRENVVIQRNAQPVDRLIQDRVQKLLL